MKYGAMQWNAAECNAMQFNAMQCKAMQSNAMECSGMQCDAMQCNAIVRSHTTIYHTISHHTNAMHLIAGWHGVARHRITALHRTSSHCFRRHFTGQVCIALQPTACDSSALPNYTLWHDRTLHFGMTWFCTTALHWSCLVLVYSTLH